MYGEASIHRLAVFLGCLGLAALMPYGVLATWLAISLAVLPLAVLELGAGLTDHGHAKNSPGFRSAGWHVQSYGALLFLTPFLVFLVSAARLQQPHWIYFVALAALGAPSCALTLFRWRHVLSGRPVPRRRRPAGPQEEESGLLARLSRIGAEPFLFGGIAVVAASLAALGIVRGVVGSSGEMLLVIGLLASAALLSVAAGLDKWEERAPGTSLGPAQDALQTLAVLGISGSLVAGGLLWNSGSWLRFLLIGAGGFALATVIAMGIKRLIERPTPYRLRAAKEGLVEHSRHGTVVYPWESVLSCSLGLVGGQPCAKLHIDDDEPSTWTVARVRSGTHLTKLLERRRAAMGCNRQWLGVDLFALREHLDVSPNDFVELVSSVIRAVPGSKDDLPALEETSTAAPPPA